MKNLIFFGFLMLVFSACDPTATQIQVVKNSSSEDLFCFRWLNESTGLFQDSIEIKVGQTTEVYNFSDVGAQRPDISCSALPSDFTGLVADDSVLVVSKTGKRLVKIWSDDKNWESKHEGGTGFKLSTSQTCTFEVKDADLK